MKLLDETWSVSEAPYLEEFYGVGTKLNAHQTLYVVSGSHAKEADVMEAAKLIAVAPQMARLLLSLLERAEDPHGDGGKAGYCPVCHWCLHNVDLNESSDPISDLRAHGHADACALMDVLHKAGVLPT